MRCGVRYSSVCRLHYVAKGTFMRAKYFDVSICCPVVCLLTLAYAASCATRRFAGNVKTAMATLVLLESYTRGSWNCKSRDVTMSNFWKDDFFITLTSNFGEVSVLVEQHHSENLRTKRLPASGYSAPTQDSTTMSGLCHEDYDIRRP